MIASRVMVLSGVFLLWFTVSLGAQELRIGTATVIPAQPDVIVPIYLSSDDDITAIEMGISYPESRLTLNGVSLANGVLDGVHLEFKRIEFPALGEVTIELTIDSQTPFTADLPAGDDQLIA